MKSLKSIAIVWEQLAWGGVDTFLKYLLNSQNFSHLDVTIFTNDTNKGLDRLKKSLSNKNVKFVKYKSVFGLEDRGYFLKILLYAFKPLIFCLSIMKFKKLFSNKKYDVLMATCGGYGSFRNETAAIFAANRNNIPVRTLWITHACTHYPPLMGGFLKLINHYLSKTLSSVISTCYATRETIFNKSNLLDRDYLHEVVIYLGIPHVEKGLTNNFFDKYEKKDGVFNVGMMSRIEEYKGHLDLVSAINLLPINYREKLRFFIIGNGEKKYVEKIKNLITNHGLEKNFIFTGYLNTEYNTILPNLDLSIDLTRSNNGFGFSPAEAVSLSVPVIVTSVGAIPEWLNDKYCSVIRPASIIDIKNELVSFIDKNEFWKKRAKDAAIYINREFNAENMASNLIVHFEQKLNELP